MSACAEDRKNVRKFMEDLLEEGEYQRVRRHVQECASCRQFVRAAGSISSLLMDMGRTACPADLADAALFHYDKMRREQPASPPSPAVEAASPVDPVAVNRPSDRLWKALVVVLAAALAWTIWGGVQTKDAPAPPTVVTVPAVAPVSPRADFEWGHLHLHWPSGREELSVFVAALAHEVRYEAPGLLVVRVPAEHAEAWQKAIEEYPGLVMAEDGSVEPPSGSDRLYSFDYREA